MHENSISYSIRGAIFEVYNHLGAGLLESAYVAALEWELKNEGFAVRREVPVPINYKGVKLEEGFRIDLLVENKVLIEIKSVEKLTKVHHKQVLTYLKIIDIKLGILVNFNVADISNGIFRKVRGL